ncbi:hypothetical protein FRC03_002377 [Tulasnella sp. 419]|nr:hypothetical protein FRC03_002377 [Tulasnella sp. 419]
MNTIFKSGPRGLFWANIWFIDLWSTNGTFTLSKITYTRPTEQRGFFYRGLEAWVEFQNCTQTHGVHMTRPSGEIKMDNLFKNHSDPAVLIVSTSGYWLKASR